jgi:prolipoprotein diacylglyceryltransferase
LSPILHSTDGSGAHIALEALAYFVAARVYWMAARRQLQPAQLADRLLLLGFAIFSAALGSKLLHVAEHLAFLLASGTPAQWLGGKSVLGGLIGGTLGVELGKKLVGWQRSTGDAWVPALAAGLVIGRLGCQLSSTWDQTYGVATTLPWGWDYGDGITRHPTGLYEMVAVAALWWLVDQRWTHANGARFAAFMAGYCVLRLGLECLKPPFGPAAIGTLPASLYLGLSAIQWAALAGTAGYLLLLRYRLRPVPYRPH